MSADEKIESGKSGQDNFWSIRPAQNQREREEALSLMIQESDPDVKRQEVEKIVLSVKTGRLDLKHLLIATKEREIRAALLMVAQEDKTAILWPPAYDEELEDSDSLGAIQDLLLEKVVLLANEECCNILQTTVDAADFGTSRLFERNGIPAVGTLFFMQRPAFSECNDESNRVTEDEKQSLQLVPISQGISDEILGELVLETYIDSADFPELQQHRTATLSLQTHRLQGEYNPDHWFVIKQDKAAVGVLFFAFHPDYNQWELSYLGIVPQQRGKNLARCAIKKSLEHTERKKSSIFLGVDSRNHYAIRLYESLGFVVVSRQRVHALQIN